MAKESDTVNGISNLSTWDAKVMNLRPIRVLLVAGQHGLQGEFLTQEKSQKGRQSVGGGDEMIKDRKFGLVDIRLCLL